MLGMIVTHAQVDTTEHFFFLIWLRYYRAKITLHYRDSKHTETVCLYAQDQRSLMKRVDALMNLMVENGYITIPPVTDRSLNLFRNGHHG